MQNRHRLPSHIKPTRYSIAIKPDLENFSFEGQETVDVVVSIPSSELVLHSADIEVKDVILTLSTKQKLETKKISYNKASETVTFHFAKKFSGKIRLSLKFTGNINDELRGFYRSRYVHGKTEKYLATTQFEATDARRAFPCFDEPSHKAVFDVSVIIPKHLKALSNTIETSILPHDPGFKVIKFAPTPKMSTYLLAFIIGEFEHLRGKTKSGVQIRIHTTPGKKSQSKFALDVAKRSLEYLENYFGIRFPLPVLDLIAIPDFSAGAMENWGAVTFRETALLVDEEHTTFLGKQRVAEVIAHELVHQWFGNLVTMEWWTHLWLNESFATYMAYHTVDSLFPEWNIWTKFVLQEQSYAFEQDSLASTHPIEVEVSNPAEIAEIFDGISYAKGASVLRMLESYIGPEGFRKGISLYLKKHSYKNTSSIHLWEAFEQASKLPVRKFMASWTAKPGFPVVEVVSANEKVSFAQKPFSYPKNRPAPVQWMIPLNPDMGNDQPHNWVLNKTATNFTIPEDAEYLNLNHDERSLFLPHYDAKSLARLLPLLEEKKLSNIDRLSIVRSSAMLSKSGLLTSDVFLEILRFLKNEDSYIVWAEAASGLNDLITAFWGTKISNKLESFKLELFGGLLGRADIGFTPIKGERQNIQNVRALAILEAGLSGHKPTVNFCKSEFRKKLQGKRINADTRYAVYSVVAGNEKNTIADLMKIYRKSNLAQEKQQALSALCRIAGSTAQKEVLEILFSADVRDQDRHLLLSQALGNPQMKQMAWQRVKSGWDILKKKYEAGRGLGIIISGASAFNTQEELKDFEQFVRSNGLTSAKQAVRQAKEKIGINIHWRTRDMQLLWDYLK